MSAPVLELDGLTAGYDSAAVIRDIDLEVAPGEVVALLGANGAGKTTTLRAVSGLVHPLEGAIRFEGQDLRRVSAERAARARHRARPGVRAACSSGSRSRSTSASATGASGSTRTSRTGTSPRSPSSATGAAACSPAASSRCSPSGERSPAIPSSCCSTSSASAWRR